MVEKKSRVETSYQHIIEHYKVNKYVFILFISFLLKEISHIVDECIAFKSIRKSPNNVTKVGVRYKTIKNSSSILWTTLHHIIPQQIKPPKDGTVNIRGDTKVTPTQIQETWLPPFDWGFFQKLPQIERADDYCPQQWNTCPPRNNGERQMGEYQEKTSILPSKMLRSKIMGGCHGLAI